MMRTHQKLTAMNMIADDVEPIHVLLVEDEFLISEWVAESLQEQGFDVHCEANAADALAHLACAPVDVLFTDVNLPGDMDGTALARRARALLPELSVVYASARVMLDPQMRVAGSVFVPKPYTPALIGRLIANTVKSTAARALV